MRKYACATYGDCVEPPRGAERVRGWGGGDKNGGESGVQGSLVPDVSRVKNYVCSRQLNATMRSTVSTYVNNYLRD